MLPAVQPKAAAKKAAAASPCTMTSTRNTTQFKTTTGQSIQKEDALSTDLTASQKLVLRSLSGPSQYFRLSSLTSASCHDVTKYPAEEGSSVNTFNATGTGSFGPDRTHTSPGFSIKFEFADRGDSSSADDTSVDFVNFTVTNGSGAVVWTGKGTLTGGSQEIAQAAVVTGSCQPSSSLAVLVSGSNVTSYVPKGNWSAQSSVTDVSAVNVEGSSITPTRISTPNAVNSSASNGTTGETVAVSNGTDVYTFSGTTLTNTLTDGGSGFLSFSGGSPTTGSVAMDATHNSALIGLSTSSGPGFQFLDLATNTFGTAFTSPSGAISEDPLIDPIRNLLLSATENNNYEIVDVSNQASPKFYENPVTTSGELDSSGEDCSTGIALAPSEFTSNVYIADLTQATLTPGSPSGTWSAPSQVQTLSESSLSAGFSGIAVAQGTHTGVITGEFGGNAITAIALPTTSGSGTPAISDWVTCGIGSTPDGAGWSEGDDPHTVNAYQSPNGGDAIGLFANSGATWLARVDLTKLLDPTTVPRTTGGHACASGTIPSSVESFISVP